MDYLNHFALNNEPFANSPVNRFYFHSTQHDQALKRLTYVASSMKGLAVCIGNVGHGKTTLARRLLDHLLDNNYEAAMLIIVHEGVSATWLLRRIAMQLGVPDPGDEKLTIINRLYQRLVELHEAGRKAVVIIDEAQMLNTKEIMEEFRGLLNIEVPGHKLISFIFFGLPELETHLMLDPPLAQRVAMKYHIGPFDEANTYAYINFRMEQAGAQREVFTSEAITAIHQASHGIPRVINTICDNALLEAYLCNLPQVTDEIVEMVAQNLGPLTMTEEEQAQSVIAAPQVAHNEATEEPSYFYQPVASPNAYEVTTDVADSSSATVYQPPVFNPADENVEVIQEAPVIKVAEVSTDVGKIDLKKGATPVEQPIEAAFNNYINTQEITADPEQFANATYQDDEEDDTAVEEANSTDEYNIQPAVTTDESQAFYAEVTNPVVTADLPSVTVEANNFTDISTVTTDDIIMPPAVSDNSFVNSDTPAAASIDNSNVVMDVNVEATSIDDDGMDVDVTATPIDDDGMDVDVTATSIDDDGMDVDVTATAVDDDGMDVDITATAVDDDGMDVDVTATSIDDDGMDVDVTATSIDDDGMDMVVDVSATDDDNTNNEDESFDVNLATAEITGTNIPYDFNTAVDIETPVDEEPEITSPDLGAAIQVQQEEALFAPITTPAEKPAPAAAPTTPTTTVVTKKHSIDLAALDDLLNGLKKRH